MKDALILFTRVPIPGQTKTRLMPFLTGEECARLHACFVKDIYEKAKQVDADIFVFFTPRNEKKASTARFLIMRQYVFHNLVMILVKG